MITESISTKQVEQCELCNGAGLLPSELTEMKVAPCWHCNGHGVVIVHEWMDANFGEVIRRVAYA